VCGSFRGVVAATVAMLLIPAAVAVAVLRHRFYGIDVLVNRALVYRPGDRSPAGPVRCSGGRGAAQT